MDSAIARFLAIRRNNPSKTQRWILEEDAHNLFAFCGGFVDSAGYMKLQGLFTSSVTGNLIASTASIYSTYGVPARILVVLGFVLGALLTSGATLKLKLHLEWSVKSILLFGATVEILLLALTMLLGFLFEKTIDTDHSLGSWQLILVAAIMGMSMGSQCAVVKDAFPTCPSTTVVTMLLVTFATHGSSATNYFLAANDLLYLHPSSKKKPDDFRAQHSAKKVEMTGKFVSTVRQLVAFLVGGLVGAVMMSETSFYSLFVPIGLLFLLMFDVYLARQHELNVAASSKSNAISMVSETLAETPHPVGIEEDIEANAKLSYVRISPDEPQSSSSSLNEGTADNDVSPISPLPPSMLHPSSLTLTPSSAVQLVPLNSV